MSASYSKVAPVTSRGTDPIPMYSATNYEMSRAMEKYLKLKQPFRRVKQPAEIIYAIENDITHIFPEATGFNWQRWNTQIVKEQAKKAININCNEKVVQTIDYEPNRSVARP